LAYCSSEDERRWLITSELELFRYRFQVLTKSEQLTYLNDSTSNIKQFYELVTDDDKQQNKDNLIAATWSKGLNNQLNTSKSFDTIAYFRVRFQHVPDLIRKRACFLAHGYAYVADSDIISFVLQHFRMNLSYQMTCSSRKFPSMEHMDTRIDSIVKILRKKRLHGTSNATSNTFNDNEQTEVITFEMLTGLSKRSFPLCMRHLHEQMIQQHHLKHLGRLQYRLFLKGIDTRLHTRRLT
jgi:DNA primase large subunit